MMDMFYLGVAAVFFLATGGVILLCHRLAEPKSEEPS